MTRTWLLIIGAMATIGFAIILLVAIPQVLLVSLQAPAELKPYSIAQQQGRLVYIQSGCLYCHSQQVRDDAFTTDVARGWGERPSVPADYVYDEPHLLGTMRTGPDLSNVGVRLPSKDWHLIHLYQPRALVEWSIMPSFRYLFEEKEQSAVGPNEYVVPVDAAYVPAGNVVVATPDALALTEYLIGLQHNYPVQALGEEWQGSLFCVPEYGAVDGRSAETMP